MSNDSRNRDDWRPIANTSRQVVLRHWPSGQVVVQARHTGTPQLFSETPSHDSHAPSVGLVPLTRRLSLASQGRDLVLGTAELQLERHSPPLRPDTPHILQTCPYCFQTIPEADFPDIAGPSRFEYAGSDDGQSTTSDRTFEEVEDPTNVDEVVPNRAARRTTQLFRTQPYFRMLEQSIDSRPATPMDRSRSTTPLQSRRHSSAGLQGEAVDAGLHREGIDVEGYYKKFVMAEPTRSTTSELTLHSQIFCGGQASRSWRSRDGLPLSALSGRQFSFVSCSKKGCCWVFENVSGSNAQRSAATGGIEAQEYHCYRARLDRTCFLL